MAGGFDLRVTRKEVLVPCAAATFAGLELEAPRLAEAGICS